MCLLPSEKSMHLPSSPLFIAIWGSPSRPVYVLQCPQSIITQSARPKRACQIFCLRCCWPKRESSPEQMFIWDTILFLIKKKLFIALVAFLIHSLILICWCWFSVLHSRGDSSVAFFEKHWSFAVLTPLIEISAFWFFDSVTVLGFWVVLHTFWGLFSEYLQWNSVWSGEAAGLGFVGLYGLPI